MVWNLITKLYTAMITIFSVIYAIDIYSDGDFDLPHNTEDLTNQLDKFFKKLRRR